MSLSFEIVRGKSSDLEEIQSLFVQTIESVCTKDYSPNQIEAWVSSIENSDRWNDLVTNQYFIKAVYNSIIIGFATLANNNYVDFLYIHKDFQGQGIAKQLLANMEEVAKINKQTILSSDVSLTAKGFFEKSGFNVQLKQNIERLNVKLENFKMTKALIPLEI